MSLRVALAQIAARVGDVRGNVDQVLDAWHRAADLGADVAVFTELALTGYSPEDLLFTEEFVDANLAALDRLVAEGPHGTAAIVGYVDRMAPPGGDDPMDTGARTTRGGQWPGEDVVELTNSAAVLADGIVAATYTKGELPGYGVFDEPRYFAATPGTCIVRIAGVEVGVTICEDLWVEAGAVADTARSGARLVANLNASPYHRGKRDLREAWVAHHATRDGTWIAYVNVVGGQDEVVFDGDSFVTGPDGQVHARGAQFVADLVVVDLPLAPTADPQNVPVDAEVTGRTERPDLAPHRPAARFDAVAEVWEAVVLATRDYCHRNGFADAVIGLSGGIDSAVTAAIAVAALGADHVTGLLMPSPYSSDHSLSDAAGLADGLGIARHTVRIDAPLRAVGDALGDLVVTGFERADGQVPGVAYENLQSRLRGVALMAVSNETGAIVLTTGNKSEYAVGYATLYGDMAGGFAPLKDVAKLLVYDLARWCNEHPDHVLGDRSAPGVRGDHVSGDIIPTATIDKPPSAELRPDQVDADSLPSYTVLDDLIAGYVEQRISPATLIARGHDEDTVRRVVRMIDLAEYKRRQAAPGPKITEHAFGRDRRVPITTGWHS